MLEKQENCRTLILCECILKKWFGHEYIHNTAFCLIVYNLKKKKINFAKLKLIEKYTLTF